MRERGVEGGGGRVEGEGEEAENEVMGEGRGEGGCVECYVD